MQTRYHKIKKELLIGSGCLLFVTLLYFFIFTPVALKRNATAVANGRPFVVCNYRYEPVDSMWTGFRQGFLPVFLARAWYFGDGYFTPYVGIVVNGDDCESNTSFSDYNPTITSEERYIWSIRTLHFVPAHQVFFNVYTYELSRVYDFEKIFGSK